MVLDERGTQKRFVTYDRDSPELTVNKDDTKKMSPATQPGE